MSRGSARLSQLKRHFQSEVVSIGSITKELKVPKNPELVPVTNLNLRQEFLNHLQWILKKDLLGQDIFLIGPPGPLKRRLALAYLSLTKREAEFIQIHPDTASESDLKQKREIVIVNGRQELVWIDSSCVRAAIHGRVLVIEGIEKAERNVLPVLNNLLENREMNLENGKRIVSPKTFDSLLTDHSLEELEQLGFIRAHPDFRVIAIGNPVPKFPGKPLDPPFRSRFQARYVDTLTLLSAEEGLVMKDEQLGNILNVVSAIQLSSTRVAEMSAENLLPSFNQIALDNIVAFYQRFPSDFKLNFKSTLDRFWPTAWVHKDLTNIQLKILVQLMQKFKIDNRHEESTLYQLFNVSKTSDSLGSVEFRVGKDQLKLPVILGSNPIAKLTNFHPSSRCMNILSQMAQAHAVDQDFILVGPSSSSKTTLILQFAAQFGYQKSQMHLYRDMSTRDFLQRRNTLQDGSTVWTDSRLVNAAKTGKLVVLEGLEWVSADVLAGISRLLQDREVSLPDNSILMKKANYDRIKFENDYSDADMLAKGIHCIHPSFRVCATVTVDKDHKSDWFNQEIAGLFHYVKVPEMSFEEEKYLLKQNSNCSDEVLLVILNFAKRYRELSGEQGHENVLSKSIKLSTRQLIRLSKLAGFEKSDLYSVMKNACLAPFMPAMVKTALEEVLCEVGLQSQKQNQNIEISVTKDKVSFGDISLSKYVPHRDDVEAKSLIPQTSQSSQRDHGFFENHNHKKVLRDLALDYSLGDHLLVIGNQGVGKNKLTDRFLELVGLPREYIQLHRDTTVHSLLVQAVLETGRIVYKDSPLVKAVQNGRVLVVDEADKAPVYITSILRSLVEYGEMDLPDGRRIRKHQPGIPVSPNDIILHPDFRMIVLANRPGFPFLGNDFYGAIGQVFATIPVENPDFDSEVELLSQLAPSINVSEIKQLVAAFGELRALFDNGELNYPYSLRELINLVKHRNEYPDEPLELVLKNVFDFEIHRKEFQDQLVAIFNKHGIKLAKSMFSEYVKVDQKLAISYGTKTPPNISGPKHGQVDKKNDPHVGGNTWAGGTGGSDTAGLGGRGGPYRLDSGNPIHQLPDELKNDVPESVLKAARDMGKQALEQKLQEINMDKYEAELFQAFSRNVQKQVQQLISILENVSANQKERIWLKNQTEGELDDTKLVEGITGEYSIYKKRGREQTQLNFHELPKRLKFVFDVSGSMYRFNSFDQRLSRSLETAMMVMQSLKGLEHKYVYDIVGHSGDSSCIEFVQCGKPPKNEKQMLQVLQKMYVHSQYCWSGDNTLRAAREAIEDVVKTEADDYFVIILSDANLQRYGIEPRYFASVIQKDPRVNVVALFIGSIGEEAKELTKQLPKGRSFYVPDSAKIPLVMKNVFTSVL